MNYPDHLNKTLALGASGRGIVLDLFCGCGGLALGFEAHGFGTVGYDINPDACLTYNANLNGRAEVTRLTPDFPFPSASVIIGGPPCQPFSVIGQQRGQQDDRDGFPTFIAAVARLQPEIFMIENVRGLFYRSRAYLDGIIDQLRQLGYLVDVQLLNAVNFEVPQNRERVIIVGHRGWYRFPTRSNRTFTVGDAINDIASEIPPDAKFLTPSMDTYIANYEAKSFCKTPRDLHFHKPARTLTCRNLAGATSDMQRIRLEDGRRRRLTTREAARLQSFPDSFEFIGSEGSVFEQIGNAVPPLLAHHLARSIIAYLDDTNRRTAQEIEEINQVHKGLLFA